MNSYLKGLEFGFQHPYLSVHNYPLTPDSDVLPDFIRHLHEHVHSYTQKCIHVIKIK